MFSYKANAICVAGMTMPAGAGVAASHCWNRVRKPGQLINYARFWPHRWTFAKNRTAHAQTHYRKSTQWQWGSFVSALIIVPANIQNVSAQHRRLILNRLPPLARKSLQKLRFSDRETNLHSVLGVKLCWGTGTGLLFNNYTYLRIVYAMKVMTSFGYEIMLTRGFWFQTLDVNKPWRQIPADRLLFFGVHTLFFSDYPKAIRRGEILFKSNHVILRLPIAE